MPWYPPVQILTRLPVRRSFFRLFEPLAQRLLDAAGLPNFSLPHHDTRRQRARMDHVLQGLFAHAQLGAQLLFVEQRVGVVLVEHHSVTPIPLSAAAILVSKMSRTESMAATISQGSSSVGGSNSR